MQIIKPPRSGAISPQATESGFVCAGRVVPIGNARDCFQLEYGHRLKQAVLAVNDYQPTDSKPDSSPETYLVLGGISAHRWLCDSGHAQPDHAKPGWWPGIAGPGKVLDPTKNRLISIDFLGSGNSSAPAAVDEFIVTPNDQADAISQALQHLGINRLAGVIGCSYGGNVALTLAARYPGLVGKALVLCAAHRVAVITSAYRSIQRRIVRTASAAGDTQTGLQTARQLAMLGFRTPRELQDRFAGRPVINQQTAELPVENYLLSRGTAWAQHTKAAEFICLSQSCDLVEVIPQNLRTPLWLAAAQNDAVVPFSDVQQLAAQAISCRQLHVLETAVGHDAFLVETRQVSKLIHDFLECAEQGPESFQQEAAA